VEVFEAMGKLTKLGSHERTTAKGSEHDYAVALYRGFFQASFDRDQDEHE